ncbi:MAG: hypothetical protein M0D55_14905 [Elusimicrobiota bacterium]|nr:MAG: hypothetical protein M0D55_14905 [Elusimicrobiota bacterium]
MVRITFRLLALTSLAPLLGAVGIGPRRDDGGGRREERSEDRTSAPAPAAPAHSGPGRVGIQRREPSGSSWSGPSGSHAPSAAPGRVGIHRYDVPHSSYRSGNRYRRWHGGGANWHGYYGGSRWYWTRPYNGYTWWYDEPYGRWAWWHGGHWWHAGPGGAAVVYVQGAPPPPVAVEASPAATPSGDPGPWTSPSGRRLVEVVGEDRQAILYDKTGPAPAYLRLLGRGASKVRFSKAGAGTSIMVEFADGTFALFDEDGKPLNAEAHAPAVAVPAASTTPVKIPAPPPLRRATCLRRPPNSGTSRRDLGPSATRALYPRPPAGHAGILGA